MAVKIIPEVALSHLCAVFEHLPGGDLLDYVIHHGRLRESRARKFARQIGSALDYCHAHNVVHRNLRLEAVLFSRSGDLKIIDFGLASLYDPASHLSTFCSSSYFAAPEIIDGRPYVGPEVDVWSFGVILYVLVCGRVPFDDVSMPAVRDKIRRGSVTYPRRLSTACRDLLSRMLATDPAARASMTDILAHPWMVRGFDGPAHAILPHREPLSTDTIDPQIVRDISDLGFGSEQDIMQRLTAVLESEAYRRAVYDWQHHDSTRPTGTTTKLATLLSTFGFRRRTSAQLVQSNPTRGFHPLLSIYQLAREKRQRETMSISDVKQEIERQTACMRALTPFSHIRCTLAQRWRILCKRKATKTVV